MNYHVFWCIYNDTQVEEVRVGSERVKVSNFIRHLRLTVSFFRVVVSCHISDLQTIDPFH